MAHYFNNQIVLLVSLNKIWIEQYKILCQMVIKFQRERVIFKIHTSIPTGSGFYVDKS